MNACTSLRERRHDSVIYPWLPSPLLTLSIIHPSIHVPRCSPFPIITLKRTPSPLPGLFPSPTWPFCRTGTIIALFAIIDALPITCCSLSLEEDTPVPPEQKHQKQRRGSPSGSPPMSQLPQSPSPSLTLNRPTKSLGGIRGAFTRLGARRAALV
ncbi:hypothetical protein B0T10DRAFT_116946 [Thelonectria olida]|uniref:Uncharacterized protein n=1 Tax=Thelonectria olida TaxID=1576542 RepID=A0A9P9ASV8_9HYPO|nr:hypothetical protein B0T10DRAFT_116946 [Thelonectria olida]